jgi:hypothetical protein
MLPFHHVAKSAAITPRHMQSPPPHFALPGVAEAAQGPKEDDTESRLVFHLLLDAILKPIFVSLFKKIQFLV